MFLNNRHTKSRIECVFLFCLWALNIWLWEAFTIKCNGEYNFNIVISKTFRYDFHLRKHQQITLKSEQEEYILRKYEIWVSST